MNVIRKLSLAAVAVAASAVQALGYTVQFYDAGSQVGSDQSVAGGGCATVPASPTFSTYKAGRQFIGWVARKAGIKNDASANSKSLAMTATADRMPITEDTSFIAEWYETTDIAAGESPSNVQVLTDLQESFFGANPTVKADVMPAGADGDSVDKEMPRFVRIVWGGSSPVTCRLTNTDGKDVFGGGARDESQTTTAGFSVFTNLLPGASYSYALSNGTKGSFTTKAGGIRGLWIPCPNPVTLKSACWYWNAVVGVQNVRDVGGIPLADGSRTKYGVLYRGKHMDDFHTGYFTNGRWDENWIVTKYGVKTDVELRKASQLSLPTGASLRDGDTVFASAPDGATYYNIGANAASDFCPSGAKYKPDYAKKVFTILGDAQNYPAYIHCSSGKDRTGIVFEMIEGVCGVSSEWRMREYMTSNFANLGGTQELEDCTYLEDYIKGKYGKNDAKAYYDFLTKEIGVTRDQINTVTTMYVGKTIEQVLGGASGGGEEEDPGADDPVTPPVTADFTPVSKASLTWNAYGNDEDPWGVSVSFYDGPNTRGFAWQTRDDVTGSSLTIVPGAHGKADDAAFAGGTGCTVKSTLTNAKADKSIKVYVHHAHTAALADGTYSYRLGTAGHYAYGTFKVDSEDSSVKVLNVNDVQIEHASELVTWENSARAIAAKLNLADLDFALNGGDFADDAGDLHEYYGAMMPFMQWGIILDTGKLSLPADLAWQWASGNHDPSLYETVTEVNRDTTGGHSFDYGNVHFVTLKYVGDVKSTATAMSDKWLAELAWLESDLAAANASGKTKWNVVTVHWGPYTTGDHGYKPVTELLVPALTPILAKGKVDLVLQAHDHTFSKTYPYYWAGAGYTTKQKDTAVVNFSPSTVTEGGVKWDIDPNGTYYVSCGAAGVDVGNAAPYAQRSGSSGLDSRKYRTEPAKVNVKSSYLAVGADASASLKAQMFGELKIEGDYLSYDFYAVDSTKGTIELVDTLRVKKTGGAGDQPGEGGGGEEPGGDEPGDDPEEPTGVEGWNIADGYVWCLRNGEVDWKWSYSAWAGGSLKLSALEHAGASTLDMSGLAALGVKKITGVKGTCLTQGAKSVILPATLTEIGAYLFAKSTAESVTVKATSALAISIDIACDSAIRTLTVEAPSVTVAGKAFHDMAALTDIYWNCPYPTLDATTDSLRSCVFYGLTPDKVTNHVGAQHVSSWAGQTGVLGAFGATSAAKWTGDASATATYQQNLVTYDPGTDEPGTDEPGGDEPGGDEPGGDEPGGDEPSVEPGEGDLTATFMNGSTVVATRKFARGKAPGKPSAQPAFRAGAQFLGWLPDPETIPQNADTTYQAAWYGAVDVAAGASPTDVQIHTPIQEAYVGYSPTIDAEGLPEAKADELGNVGGALSVRGKSYLDLPRFVRVVWGGSDTATCTLSSDYGTETQTSSAGYAVFTNLHPLATYTYRVTGAVTKSGTITTARSALYNFIVPTPLYRPAIDSVTNCHLYGFMNFRDVGGLPLACGGYTRYDRLIRGRNSDTMVVLYAEGVPFENWLETRFGVRSEIELRPVDDVVDDGGAPFRDGMPRGSARIIAFQGSSDNADVSPYYTGEKTNYTCRIFTLLGHSANYPFYIHCKGGIDRTGLIYQMIEGLCGVPQEWRKRDLLFSNFCNHGSEKSVSAFTKFENHVAAFPGGNDPQKFRAFLNSVGVSDKSLNVLTRQLVGKSLAEVTGLSLDVEEEELETPPQTTPAVEAKTATDFGWTRRAQVDGRTYRVVAFTRTGAPIEWTVPDGVSALEWFVVAGGGGGGSSKVTAKSSGGGGGAGFIRFGTQAVSGGEQVRVSVGAGGAPGADRSTAAGANGGDSSLTVGSTLVCTALGGGGGGKAGGNGLDGGCGGGGGYGGEGGKGVNGDCNGNKGTASRGAGGGGSVMGAGTGLEQINSGAPGLRSWITGECVTYGQGGMGGRGQELGAAGAEGGVSNGNGGSGAGNNLEGTAYTSATPGADGIVIVRYLDDGGEPITPVDPPVDPPTPGGDDPAAQFAAGDFSRAVVCFGDSLTYGSKSEMVYVKDVKVDAPNYQTGLMGDSSKIQASYPYFLAKGLNGSTDWKVYNVSKSGALAEAITAWTMTFTTAQDVTLAADTATAAEFHASALVGNGVEADVPYLSSTEQFPDWRETMTGTLDGERVRFGADGFVRLVAGESKTIPAGATFVPDMKGQFAKSVAVFFAGANDSSSKVATWSPFIEAAAGQIDGGRYLVVVPHMHKSKNMGTAVDEASYATAKEKWTADIAPTEAALAAKFAGKCIVLRTALDANWQRIVTKLGLSVSATNWDWPGTGLLASDGLHFNESGYRVVAELVREKLDELGYLNSQPCSHDWQVGSVVEATCEEPGETNWVCSVCTATRVDVIPAKGHRWNETTHKCDVCGADEPVVPPTPVGETTWTYEKIDSLNGVLWNSLDGGATTNWAWNVVWGKPTIKFAGLIRKGSSAIDFTGISEALGTTVGALKSVNTAGCLLPDVTYVRIPATLQKIDNYVFYQSGVSELAIEAEGELTLAAYFAQESAVKKLTVSANAVTLVSYTFRDMASLTDIYWNTPAPAAVERASDEKGAFYGIAAKTVTNHVGAQYVASWKSAQGLVGTFDETVTTPSDAVLWAGLTRTDGGTVTTYAQYLVAEGDAPVPTWDVPLTPDGKSGIRGFVDPVTGEPVVKFGEIAFGQDGLTVRLLAQEIVAEGVRLELVCSEQLAGDETIRIPATLTAAPADPTVGTISVAQGVLGGRASMFILGIGTASN